eukprot:27993-Hanusia_phi.AAC.1
MKVRTKERATGNRRQKERREEAAGGTRKAYLIPNEGGREHVDPLLAQAGGPHAGCSLPGVVSHRLQRHPVDRHPQRVARVSALRRVHHHVHDPLPAAREGNRPCQLSSRR